MSTPTSQQLAAWRLFLTLHRRAVDSIDHELQSTEQIPLSSYDVLIELYGAPDRRLRMAELAERVLLSRSGLTRLVDRLEGEGYLVRERVDGDRRGAYAVLTAAGNGALATAWPTYARGIMSTFAGGLSAEEIDTLTKILQKIARHLAT